MTIPNRPRPLPALGATIALAVLIAACSGAPDEKADTRSEAGASPVSAAGDPGPSRTTAAGAPAAADDNAPIIGSSTGQHPADPNDETLVPLRLDIRSLKRVAGNTVQVRFTITNTSDTAVFEPWGQLSGRNSSYDVGAMALLDRPGDKKYLTLYDTGNACLCTEDLSNLEIKPGMTVAMYADVTAPPETVSTVDLSLPGFTPIAGLKIQ